MTPAQRLDWLRRACAENPGVAVGHLAVAAVLDEHGHYREADAAEAVRIVSEAMLGAWTTAQAPTPDCCRVTASACEARTAIGRPRCCDRCTH